VERCWQSPRARPVPRACDPDPRENSLPPTNCPSDLCTAAAHKWASRDGNLRQLFRVEKHVKTCRNGLPARQSPVSPRLVRSLAAPRITCTGEEGSASAVGALGWMVGDSLPLPVEQSSSQGSYPATGTRVWDTFEARAQPEHQGGPGGNRRHRSMHPWLSCDHPFCGCIPSAG